MIDEYNPIKAIDGVAIKCPSSYQWKLQDISESDAGRTEDTVMDKKRIGQCVKLELQWKNITIAEAADILKRFNPEYFNVTYLDAMEGKYLTKEFYVGDRSAPLYNCTKGIWSSVSFNIIERSGI
jgi:hypothetical protein